MKRKQIWGGISWVEEKGGRMEEEDGRARGWEEREGRPVRVADGGGGPGLVEEEESRRPPARRRRLRQVREGLTLEPAPTRPPTAPGTPPHGHLSSPASGPALPFPIRHLEHSPLLMCVAREGQVALAFSSPLLPT